MILTGLVIPPLPLLGGGGCFWLDFGDLGPPKVQNASLGFLITNNHKGSVPKELKNQDRRRTPQDVVNHQPQFHQ